MSEISFQAVQFLPRFFSFAALFALTWLIARFAKHLVRRATVDGQNEAGVRSPMSRILSSLAFWTVFAIMMPFMLNAVGFNTNWLHQTQQVLAQVFINWPLWMILSLLVAGIAYLVRNIPRFLFQVKGSFETSQREA